MKAAKLLEQLLEEAREAGEVIGFARGYDQAIADMAKSLEQLTPPQIGECVVLSVDNAHQFSDVFTRTLEEAGIGNRWRYALARDDINTIGDLAMKSERDLQDLRGLGPKALDDAKRVLARYGLMLQS